MVSSQKLSVLYHCHRPNDDVNEFSAVLFQKIPFGSLWSGNKAVVFFMRRFGCVLCRHTAFKLSKMAPQLSANSVRLAAIGPEKLGYEEFKQGKFFAGGERFLPILFLLQHGLVGKLIQARELIRVY